MKTKTYTTIDRHDWPNGEWDTEPDKMQWPDEDTGLPCLAVRHPRMGHWCGYVGVLPEHPMYEHAYSCDELEAIRVHGGLTFAEKCRSGVEASSICHVPAAGEPDHVWWFGFDCGHCDDISPLAPWGIDRQYRTLSYVRNECKELASQLEEMRTLSK